MIKYALILTHDRFEETCDVINDIKDQVDRILVIDNASKVPFHTLWDRRVPGLWIIRDLTKPANLAYLWNLGLSQIAMQVRENEPYKVAMLTDDVRIPAGWFRAVSNAMDSSGAAAGCSSPWPNATTTILKREPDRDIVNRMFGPAFIVRGEANLVANEDLKWWWNDTDLDWKARGAGGMVMVPGYVVENRYPNASTVGENAIQAGRDREAFGAFWGTIPW